MPLEGTAQGESAVPLPTRAMIFQRVWRARARQGDMPAVGQASHPRLWSAARSCADHGGNLALTREGPHQAGLRGLCKSVQEAAVLGRQAETQSWSWPLGSPPTDTGQRALEPGALLQAPVQGREKGLPERVCCGHILLVALLCASHQPGMNSVAGPAPQALGEMAQACAHQAQRASVPMRPIMSPLRVASLTCPKRSGRGRGLPICGVL